MLLEPMNTWLLCEWSGMLYVGCVHVRGVACVYCAIANGALRLEGACCHCAPSVWCDMFVTSFTRVDCCSLPHARNAVNVQQVRRGPCAYFCVRMRGREV